MNRLQYLLTVLSEECDEIGKLCSKSQRFGLNSLNPETGKVNNIEIHKEMNDVLAVLRLLNTEFNLGFEVDENLINAKIEKMQRFEEYSIEIGALSTEPVPEHLYPKPQDK